MTQAELDQLNRGDIITHVTGNSYVVLQRHGKHLTAIREIDVSNPAEWTVFSRNPRVREPKSAPPPRKATNLRDPDHLNPAKGGNRTRDDYW